MELSNIFYSLKFFHLSAFKIYLILPFDLPVYLYLHAKFILRSQFPILAHDKFYRVTFYLLNYTAKFNGYEQVNLKSSKRIKMWTFILLYFYFISRR